VKKRSTLATQTLRYFIINKHFSCSVDEVFILIRETWTHKVGYFVWISKRCLYSITESAKFNNEPLSLFDLCISIFVTAKVGTFRLFVPPREISTSIVILIRYKWASCQSIDTHHRAGQRLAACVMVWYQLNSPVKSSSSCKKFLIKTRGQSSTALLTISVFVFWKKVSSPQKCFLQVFPSRVSGPFTKSRSKVFSLLLVPVIATLTVGCVRVLLRTTWARDWTLVWGGFTCGRGWGDNSAAPSV